MTKEGTPLSAAERIIAAMNAEKQANALAEAEKLAREQAEQRKLIIQAEQLQEDCRKMIGAFREIDRRFGLTASLGQINTEVLKGKGSIRSFLPRVETSFWSGTNNTGTKNIREVSIIGEISDELEWKEGIFRHRVKVRYVHSPEFSKSPFVLISGGGRYDYDMNDGYSYAEPISVGGSEFQEKFQSSLAAAFKHSTCHYPEPDEVING